MNMTWIDWAVVGAVMALFTTMAVIANRGEWTDYWNNGCGSLALETQMMRRGAGAWRAARALAQASGVRPNSAIEKETLENLLLAHEHTVTAFCSTAAFGPSRQLEPLPIAQQWYQKAACCSAALSHAEMLQRDALDAAASNPVQTRDCKGLLVFNPADLPRRLCLRVPTEILAGNYPLMAGTKHRLDVIKDLNRAEGAEWIGPIELPPKVLLRYRLSDCQRAALPEGVAVEAGSIRSPACELSFDPITGRIFSLKKRDIGRELIDAASESEFFGPVRETVALTSEKSKTAGDPRYDLFQVGGFNYGRGLKNAAGLNQAFLVAWPMNNYWNTNFRASQPGFIRLHYEMTVMDRLVPVACAQFGSSCTTPVIWHPSAA